MTFEPSSSKMLEPPELREPIQSLDERAILVGQLMTLQQELTDLTAAADQPLSFEMRSRLSRAITVEGDSPELLLRRWVTIFSDEFKAVRDVRNQVAHGIRVSDYDLRGAVWLAAHLRDLLDKPAGSRI